MKLFRNRDTLKNLTVKNLTIKPLAKSFFNKDSQELAKTLLGKVIYRKYNTIWLAAQIIETESYYLHEKGSHASLGYTHKKRALFAQPGTIYMYYSRAGDSFNISAHGKGNAVLIKSAYPYEKAKNYRQMIQVMKRLNPNQNGSERDIKKLCAGQTLLCKSLNLKVKDWDAKQFNKDFFISDGNHTPSKIIQTRRLGIRHGRDEHLLYRFIDYNYDSFCTKSVLRSRTLKRGKDYKIITV